MAQLVLLLILLFSVSCVFYGIAAGVRGIQRSWVSFLESCSNKESKDKEESLEYENRANIHSSEEFPIKELKILFELYETGALTRIEYEQLKRHIFSVISKH